MLPLVIGGAMALGGAYASYKGAQKAGDYQLIDQAQVKRDLQPWQNSINAMSGRSRQMYDRADEMYEQSQQFFDPNSDYYNKQRQIAQQQIGQQSANTALQQQKLMASRGMGGGGLRGLLGAASANQAGEQSRLALQNMQTAGVGLGQRQQQLSLGASGQGGNLMSTATQQQGAHSENIAQAYLSNISTQNQANQAQAAGYMGIGQGLLGGAGTIFGKMA